MDAQYENMYNKDIFLNETLIGVNNILTKDIRI